MIVLSIPCRPVGANQVSGGWQSHERARKQTKQDAQFVWMEAGRPVYPDGARIRVRCVFGTGGRRDASNYAGAGSVKWVLDALTECGAWPDDAQRWLDLVGVETVYRRNEWAVEIEIEAVEQDGVA